LEKSGAWRSFFYDKDGVLEHPRLKGIIGQHVMPFIPVGKSRVPTRTIYGPLLMKLYITVKAKEDMAAMQGPDWIQS